MIKPGQIYREINAPQYRKPDKRPFVITKIYFTSVYILFGDGDGKRVGFDWIKGDCELLAEFDTWQEALSHLPNIK